jgi:beta-glucosidase
MKKLKELGKPMVLVMLNGSALGINWENQSIPAILEAWYPGQAGGTAIADVLFGDYNPAGRLPLTFYKDINDIPAFDDYSMKGKTYRYFKGTPLYDFGFGLSYANFQYSNLEIKETINAGQAVQINVNVTNTSKVDGDEVVQVYFSNPIPDERDTNRTLVAFERVFIKASETKKVSFTIDAKQLAQFKANTGLTLSSGQLTFSVGGMQPKPDRIKDNKVIVKTINVTGTTVVY